MGEWSRKEKAQAIAALAAGHDDAGCAVLLELLGVAREKWPELKAAVLGDEGERLEGQTDHEVYGEYVTRQTSILNELTDIRAEFKKAEKPNQMAMLGCLRAQSEIHDKILKVGQEMGFVRREPDRQEIGISAEVRAMSEDERSEWFETDRRDCFDLYRGEASGTSWGRSTAQLRGAARGEGELDG